MQAGDKVDDQLCASFGSCHKNDMGSADFLYLQLGEKIPE